MLASAIDAIWTADLLDIHQYACTNHGCRFILVVLDIFSSYAWARPLKNKMGTGVAAALESIIRDSGRKPKKLWTDRGTEFYNASVARVLRDNDIQLYIT